MLKSVLHRRSRIAPALAVSALIPFAAVTHHHGAVVLGTKAPAACGTSNFTDAPCVVSETATGGISLMLVGSQLTAKHTYALDLGTLAGGSLGTVACGGKTSLDGLFPVTTNAKGGFQIACTAGHTRAWTYVSTLIDETTFATYNAGLTVMQS